MSMKIIWLVINFIITILLTIFDNALLGTIYLLSFLSVLIFRGGFLATLKGFLNRDVSLKVFFKEFNKPLGINSVKAAIILFQMYFGINPILGKLIKHKFNLISLYQIPGDCLGMVIGVIIIIYMVKGIFEFVN